MTTGKSQFITVNTPVFRAAFLNLLKPRKNTLNGKDEYSVVALFPKATDLKPLFKAVEDAAASVWGADKTKWPKNLKLPFKKQEEALDKTGKIREGYEKGAWYLNLKCDAEKKVPGIVDAKLEPILDPNDIYSGMYARAQVSFFAFNQPAAKGVTLVLNHVQKVKEGTPIGTSTRAEDAFTVIDDGQAELPLT